MWIKGVTGSLGSYIIIGMAGKVGIILNEDKLPSIMDTLLETVRILESSGRIVSTEAGFGGRPAEDAVSVVRDADAIFVFGGDGTLLRAARLVAAEEGDRQTPICPINAGSLGFLTEIRLDEAPEAAARFARGEYGLSERMMLSAEHLDKDGRAKGRFMALNDIVVSRGLDARIFSVSVSIRGDLLYGLYADGVIVSTPTGSTAYNLAAGGPIVDPGLEAIIVTPICPHSLSKRPIVVPPDSEIRLDDFRRTETVVLTADGQERSLPITHGEAVVVRRRETGVRLIRPFERSFFATMRRKLGSFDGENSG